jgi:NADH:ubiquinone oxidoreductase subunit 2 (subunit N)
MKKNIAFVATALALPFITFAQAIDSVQTAGDFIINIINTVAVPVLFAIAFLVFIYGIFQYFILSRGDEEKQGLGRSLMLWGLIGFFLMVSVWGLVNILIGTFSLNSNVPAYPQAPHTDTGY